MIWEDDIAILDDFTSASTQALIIGRDVTITATYRPLPTFNATVRNGTGDRSYYAGAQVNITANSAACWPAVRRMDRQRHIC